MNFENAAAMQRNALIPMQTKLDFQCVVCKDWFSHLFENEYPLFCPNCLASFVAQCQLIGSQIRVAILSCVNAFDIINDKMQNLFWRFRRVINDDAFRYWKQCGKRVVRSRKRRAVKKFNRRVYEHYMNYLLKG